MTKAKNKTNTTQSMRKKLGMNNIKHILIVCFALFAFVTSLFFSWLSIFEARYKGRVYPYVSIAGMPVGGKTPEEIKQYWIHKNEPFAQKQFHLSYQTHVATLSGELLDLGYDATLSAQQAYLIGRSPHIFNNLRTKLFPQPINLSTYFRYKDELLDDALYTLSKHIDVPAQDALFEFQNNKVTAFRTSKTGKKVHIEKTKNAFENALQEANTTDDRIISIPVVVESIKPNIATEETNSYGIKELIGTGYSEFHGSIPGRIHNVALAASRLNGVLIKPGETFSLTKTLGDISAATGYQSAYIIKDGKTILGDGGGVCQVSTTLFRAALDTGLPIVERHAHAYRVHYYEEVGEKPGLDAAVFHPSVDLKFTNDTGNYILIQSYVNRNNLSLTFEFYGVSDGRVSEIYNHQVWDQTPPPPPLYQDDPTLAPGTVKQIDWAAWGAKASFDYRVTKNSQTLFEDTFYSHFRPWQAVFLRAIAQE